jgi:hypothetical protein
MKKHNFKALTARLRKLNEALVPTPAPALSSAEDVATLPWAGNHASDSLLFRACNALIHKLADAGDTAGAIRALHLMGLHGMGIDDPTTEEDLEMYLSETSKPKTPAKESAGDFDDQWVQDRMSMSAEEVAAEFGVDLDAVKAAADKVAAGGYLYGGSPTAYFAKNGFVFDGQFEALSSPAQLASAILVAAAESGLASFKAVGAKTDFSDVADWDKDPVAQLESQTTQGTTMKKRKITRAEAFSLLRNLKEANKGKKLARFVKREDAGEGEVFIVVSGPEGDQPEIKFVDGNLLVGPFASEEEAQEAGGEDVLTVTGAEVTSNSGGGDGDAGVAPEAELEERRLVSNFLRTRPRVAEGIRARIRARIQKESEELASNDSDVKKGDGATEGGAGTTDFDTLASFVNPPEASGQKLSTPTDSDATANHIDKNVLESVNQLSVGRLVNVIDRKTGLKIDNGVVESCTKGELVLEGGEKHDLSAVRVESVC